MTILSEAKPIRPLSHLYLDLLYSNAHGLIITVKRLKEAYPNELSLNNALKAVCTAHLGEVIETALQDQVSIMRGSLSDPHEGELVSRDGPWKIVG